jgi:hypothetical protein
MIIESMKFKFRIYYKYESRYKINGLKGFEPPHSHICSSYMYIVQNAIISIFLRSQSSNFKICNKNKISNCNFSHNYENLRINDFEVVVVLHRTTQHIVYRIELRFGFT